MPTYPSVPEQHNVTWSRPAEVVPLQEQLDSGGQTNYVESRPGPYATATCSCGWSESGYAHMVERMLQEHAAAVRSP